jgi:type VI secretion system secreted protein Hcp
MASVDAYIKIDGVTGESTAKGHEKEVELLSWSWGVSNSSHGTGSGSGQGKAVGQDFSFSHHYDKASPVLQKKCIDGEHFKEVNVYARKSGGKPEDFWKVTMKQVFVTSVQHGGGSGGEITESVTMSYGSINFMYKPQKPDGTLDAEVLMGWDLKTGVTT